MIEKKLGKINSVSFGNGGYQAAMIGISFDLGGDGWGVGDFWGDWSSERSENAKWSEQDRITNLGNTVIRISKLLEQAKVISVDKLKGIPVEVLFKDGCLEGWRILTEVL